MKYDFNEDVGIRPYDYFHKVMGGKWKPYIIRGIHHNGYVRFNELLRILGISPKVLQQQLRELESDGIIQRVVYTVVPPWVDYVFTDAGKELVPIYDMIYKWSLARLKEQGAPIAPYTYIFHEDDPENHLENNSENNSETE